MRIAPLVLLVFASHAEIGLAGFTFIGPTPYLSAADSPFAEYLDGPDFYLEDFEDGELNTPGIRRPDCTPPPNLIDCFVGAEIAAPGLSTDSVDGDDGVIDGSGSAGYSFVSPVGLVLFSDPPTTVMFISLQFDRDEFGLYPNNFGFVWTDGFSGSSLAVDIVDSQGNDFSFTLASSLGDLDRTGSTMEDRFIGLRNIVGIERITLRSTFTGNTTGQQNFEIDHVQYGRIVPEPSTAIPMLIGFFWLLSPRLVGRNFWQGHKSLVVRSNVKRGGVTGQRRS